MKDWDRGRWRQTGTGAGGERLGQGQVETDWDRGRWRQTGTGAFNRVL